MMSITAPTTELHPDFSSPDATATPWERGRDTLENAEVFWLSTVRPDGRPHVTPLIAVWHEDAIYFCTGPKERKSKNLAENPSCILTTGNDTMSEGLDLVVEGRAVQVTDEALLAVLARLYDTKYGWKFEVRDGAFHHDGGGSALVFEVKPAKAFGFGKGDQFSQTRWSF